MKWLWLWGSPLSRGRQRVCERREAYFDFFSRGRRLRTPRRNIIHLLAPGKKKKKNFRGGGPDGFESFSVRSSIGRPRPLPRPCRRRAGFTTILAGAWPRRTGLKERLVTLGRSRALFTAAVLKGPIWPKRDIAERNADLARKRDDCAPAGGASASTPLGRVRSVAHPTAHASHGALEVSSKLDRRVKTGSSRPSGRP